MSLLEILHLAAYWPALARRRASNVRREMTIFLSRHVMENSPPPIVALLGALTLGDLVETCAESHLFATLLVVPCFVVIPLRSLRVQKHVSTSIYSNNYCVYGAYLSSVRHVFSKAMFLRQLSQASPLGCTVHLIFLFLQLIQANGSLCRAFPALVKPHSGLTSIPSTAFGRFGSTGADRRRSFGVGELLSPVGIRSSCEALLDSMYLWLSGSVFMEIDSEEKLLDSSRRWRKSEAGDEA